MASKQVAEYQAYRATVAARLAIVSPEPGAPSDELRALAERLVAVCDGQAGLAPPPPALTYEPGYVTAAGTFDQLVARAGVLSMNEWGSIAIPHELLRLANLVASA
jgi:hypothetical protein